MTSGSVKADSPLPAEKDPCLRPRQRSWPPLSIPPLFLLSTPAPRQSVGRPRHVRPVGTPVPRPHVKGTVCVTVLFVKIHLVTWSESGFKPLQTLTAFVVQCRVQSSWASCRSLSLFLLLSLSLAGSLPCAMCSLIHYSRRNTNTCLLLGSPVAHLQTLRDTCRRHPGTTTPKSLGCERISVLWPRASTAPSRARPSTPSRGRSQQVVPTAQGPSSRARRPPAAHSPSFGGLHLPDFPPKTTAATGGTRAGCNGCVWRAACVISSLSCMQTRALAHVGAAAARERRRRRSAAERV